MDNEWCNLSPVSFCATNLDTFYNNTARRRARSQLLVNMPVSNNISAVVVGSGYLATNAPYSASMSGNGEHERQYL